MFRIFILTSLLFSSTLLFAQTETLDNKAIVEMSRSGLSSEIILKKIGLTQPVRFDVTAASLVGLKAAGVNDAVIAAMMDRAEASLAQPAVPGTFSESGPPAPRSREDVIASAKTIAFGKSSLQPSRQALEKELLKRKDFQQLNLTILRYKESADLFVDIGYVSGSWLTHRYVYRIYDRRTGAVITAGETTSWGSLAENLARHIAKRLVLSRAGKT